jgi:IS5 family transposase
MSWKNLKQRSLADALLIEHKALTELDDVHELINWERIEILLKDIHSSPRGEQAWPPLLMFKALLLQSWYTLSDPQLEKQLARDLLFRRFVGLSLSESVPDHSTFWRFRNKPEVVALQDALLEEVNQQLTEKGLFIKQGDISIVDASVIKAQRNRPNKGVDGENTQDPEAGYNVKSGSDGKTKTTYGYKAHINVDEDDFIKSIGFTAGNVHDSQCFTELLSEKESKVFADSAYASGKTTKWLKERSIDNGVLERAYRNKPLTDQQKASNKMKSRIRCGVERVFGILKLHYGMAQARYLGKARNQMRFGVMCLAYNLKRGVSLQREIQGLQESCV